MESCCTTLEARDPAQSRFRAYRIEAGTDLLGDWVVNVTYGCIGTRGRHLRHVASDAPQARRIVRHCLQLRATAPRRVGVGYQLRAPADPERRLDEAGEDYLPLSSGWASAPPRSFSC